MRAKVAKQFTFHAAHRLPNHDGQCKRQHGHSYKLEVQVLGDVKESNGDPDEGMVLDFSVLKTIYVSMIEPYVEHENLNMTLSGKVPHTRDYLNDVPLTTCENVARWILDTYVHEMVTWVGADNWKDAHMQLSVILWETPTSYCQVYAGGL